MAHNPWKFVVPFGLANIINLVLIASANAAYWFHPPTDTGCPQWQLEEVVREITRISDDAQNESETASINGSEMPEIRVLRARRFPLDERELFGVFRALSYCKERAIPVLQGLFETEDEELKSNAILVASKIGEPALPVLLQLIEEQDTSRRLRIDIAEALGQMGEVAEPAVPMLIELLRTEEERHEKINIARALGNIGTVARPAIPALLELLQEIDSECIESETFCESGVVTVAKVLGQVGEVQFAFDILTEILTEVDSEIYLSVHDAFDLVKISAEFPETLPQLIVLLQNTSNDFNRANIALALGQLKSEARVLIPVLTQILTTEENSKVLLNTSSALLSLGSNNKEIPYAITSVIINLYNHELYFDSQLEEFLLFVTQTLDNQMQDQIPRLLVALENSTEHDIERHEIHFQTRYRIFLINVLAEIGADSEEVKHVLIQLLKNENHEIRRVAIEALGGIEPDINVLQSLLQETRISRNSAGNLVYTGNSVYESLNQPTIDNDVFFTYEQIIEAEAVGRVRARATGEVRSGQCLATDIVQPPPAVPPALILWHSEKQSVLISRQSRPILCQYPHPILALVAIGFFEDKNAYEIEDGCDVSLRYLLGYGSTLRHSSIVDCSQEGYLRTEKSTIFRRLGEAFSQIGTPSIPVLTAMLISDDYLTRIGYLESDFSVVRRVAVYGLSELDSLPDETIELLTNIVVDLGIDLDTRRLAAYALEHNNIDVQWFFDQYRLASFQNFDCRTHYQAPRSDFFVKYSGQCETHILILNGGGSLFDEIKQLLFPNNDR